MIWKHFKRRVLEDNGGWLQFIPAAISAGSALYKTIKGNDDKMGDSRLLNYEIPDFKEDPDYRQTQDYLKGLGIDMLEGDIPDYYKGIGETGGLAFDAYINQMTGDIQKSAMESSASMGRGGGRATDIATKAVGDFTTQSRFADYERALKGKEWLFGQGRGITENARSAGQAQQSQENTYGLNKSKMEIGLGEYLDGYDFKQNEYDKASDSDFYESIGSDIFGAYTGVKAAMKPGATITDTIDAMLNTDKKTTTQDPAKKLALGKINPNNLSPEALKQIFNL